MLWGALTTYIYNGQNNTFFDAATVVETGVRFVGGATVGGFYSATKGLLMDSVLSLYNAHYTSQDAIKVANDLTRWAYCGGMKSGVPLPVVAHSRGTLILRRAMTLMPREVRQCLHVYAFGPPVMLPKKIPPSCCDGSL